MSWSLEELGMNGMHSLENEKLVTAEVYKRRGVNIFDHCWVLLGEYLPLGAGDTTMIWS